jgi:hypothetical protein
MGQSGHSVTWADLPARDSKSLPCIKIQTLADDNRLFEHIFDPQPVPPPSLSSPPPPPVYDEYPFVLEIKTKWLTEIFRSIPVAKRPTQNKSKETIRHILLSFDGSQRKLSFMATDVSVSHHPQIIIPEENIIPNPFRQKKPCVDHQAVFVHPTNEISSASNISDFLTRVPCVTNDELPSKAHESLVESTRYEGVFDGHALTQAVNGKENTIVRMCLAPGKPLMIRFLLDQDDEHPEKCSHFTTWLDPLSKEDIEQQIRDTTTTSSPSSPVTTTTKPHHTKRKRHESTSKKKKKRHVSDEEEDSSATPDTPDTPPTPTPTPATQTVSSSSSPVTPPSPISFLPQQPSQDDMESDPAMLDLPF